MSEEFYFEMPPRDTQEDPIFSREALDAKTDEDFHRAILRRDLRKDRNFKE